MIGLGISIAMVIDYEINKKKYQIIYLSLFETFFSSVSMLSRAMIFNLFPFIVGFIVKINNNNFKINIPKIFYFLIIGIFLIIISIIISNNIRSNQNIYTKIKNQKEITFLKSEKLFYKQTQTNSVSVATSNLNKKIVTNASNIINNNLKNFYNLFMYRFIGIEGVMAVQGNKN